MNTTNLIYIASIMIVYTTAFMQRPYTPFRIENGQMVTLPLLICAHDVGVLNEIRCKNRNVLINNISSKDTNKNTNINKNVSLPLIIQDEPEDMMEDGEVPWDFAVEVDDGDISWWDFGDDGGDYEDEEDDGNSTVTKGYSIKPKPIIPNVLPSHAYLLV